MTSFAKAMSKTATKKPKAKAKKEMAEIFPKDDVKHAIDNYQEAKKAKKKAEGEMAVAAPIILDFAGKHQDDDGFNGDFKNAYLIKGFEDSVKYVSSNRFSIDSADVDQLRETFDENFDDLIEEKPEVLIKDAVFKDETLQKRLMDLVGDEFADFFETRVTVKVKPDFDKNIYKHVSKDELPIVRTFCRPYKPSLR